VRFGRASVVVVVVVVGAVLSLPGCGSGAGHHSTGATSKRPALSATDQAAADQMATNMYEISGHADGPDRQELQCIAEGLVAEFGATPQTESSDPGVEVRVTRANATVDIYTGCTDRWEAEFIRSRTEGAQALSEHSVSCVADQLSDDLSHSMWVTEMSGDYTDLHHLDPLLAAFDKCLTKQELDGLDWN
jgi:hypothetical protein